MTIEFRCSACSKLLRTPAGTEGKQAKCPQCGALMPIPADSAFASPPREPEFSASQDQPSAVPYQEPGQPFAAPQTDPRPAHAASGIQPTRVELTALLDQTWDIFKNHWLMCVVGALIAHVSMQVALLLFGGVLEAIASNTDGPVAFLANVLIGPVTLAISTYFSLGMIKFFLGIARSGQADIAELFSMGHLLWAGMLLQFLLILGITVGLIFLIVPGILFAITFCLAPMMLVDRRAGVRDSFALSVTAMSGNRGTVLALCAVVYFASLALTLLTCGLGLIVATPFSMLLYAVIYLSVTGQPTSAYRGVPTTASERPLYSPNVQPHG